MFSTVNDIENKRPLPGDKYILLSPNFGTTNLEPEEITILCETSNPAVFKVRNQKGQVFPASLFYMRAISKG